MTASESRLRRWLAFRICLTLFISYIIGAAFIAIPLLAYMTLDYGRVAVMSIEFGAIVGSVLAYWYLRFRGILLFALALRFPARTLAAVTGSLLLIAGLLAAGTLPPIE